MNILLVYASKTGTTENCAKIIDKKLENITVVNLLEKDVDIHEYDLIIIGSPIRMGMIHSKVKKFIRKNIDILKSKKLAIYVCCGFIENTNKYFETNIPKELIDEIIIYDSFGGEMDINKQKGIDKLITNMVSKSIQGNKEIKVLNENIDKFITKINEVK